MATLRLYNEPDGSEYVVICDNEEEVREFTEGDTLVECVEIDYDFNSWPTNRVLVQER